MLSPDKTTAFNGLSAVRESVSGVSLDAGPPFYFLFRLMAAIRILISYFENSNP